MKCIHCNAQNEERSKFCRDCGATLSVEIKSQDNSKVSDRLLIIFLAIAFIAALAQFVIEQLYENWYEGPTKYLQQSLWILQNLSFLLVPLAIKDRTFKILGLIITIILVIRWVYSNIQSMLI